MSDGSQLETTMGDSNRGKATIWVSGAFSAHLVAALVLLGVLLVTVPQYKQIFEDSGTELPYMTFAVISLSLWTAMNWYWALPLLGALDAAILFFLRRQGEKARWLAGAWVVCVLLVVILVMGLVVPALTWPPIKLMNPSRG